MSFEPDILVTTPDGVSVVIEVKATLANLDRTEEQLKRYMVGMQCPVGLLLTPDRMLLYKDSYSDRSPSSIQRVGEFDAKGLWKQPPPTDPLLFERFVQHWLEESGRRPHSELPEDLRRAFEEHIDPALAAGEVRAAHPRNP